MVSSRDALIVDSVRTGLTKSWRGTFNLTRPDDMAAHCIQALLQRNPQVAAAEFEDCVIGCAYPEGAQGHNIGRNVAILSGLPVSVPGMTLNRYCSSGLQSIAVAAHQIQNEGTEVIVAGGVESITMLQNSLHLDGLVNPKLAEKKPAIYMSMGETAEVVAERYKISRRAQDEYALLSQQRTAAAQRAGLFKDEIVPMSVTWRKKDKATGEERDVPGLVDHDECNRPDTTLEGLARLEPAFKADGTVTAGNSSQFSDGASMTLLASSNRVRALGLKPLGVFRAFVVVGVEPETAHIAIRRQIAGLDGDPTQKDGEGRDEDAVQGLRGVRAERQRRHHQRDREQHHREAQQRFRALQQDRRPARTTRRPAKWRRETLRTRRRPRKRLGALLRP